MIMLGLLISLLTLLVLIPWWMWIAECLLGLPPLRESRPGKTAYGLVIVPAHDEALGVTEMLRALRTQLRDGDRVLLVADNCQDQTAELARQEGVDVVVRNDALRRGKGYALEYGIRHASSQGWKPDVLVILDADCTIQGLAELIDETAWRGQPVQAAYTLSVEPQANARQRVSAFAFRVKNVVRLRGLRRLGGPALLTGSGMAFPWQLAQAIDWGGGEIVEDLATGLKLACGGHLPSYTELAWVESPAPTSEQGVAQQRTRWEHGYLAQMQRGMPQLLRATVARRSVACAWAFLDLAIPPLSLFIVLLFGWLLLMSGVAFWTGQLGPWWWTLATGILATLTLGGCWWCEGRRLLPPRSLLAIPGYILRKLPLYGGFLRRRQTTWERTTRA
jgi:cellulose synthase/poly-beta-1,6-N-acetylglucosamine synthase-like glycosyltransferase